MWPQPLGCIPCRFHMFCIYATNLDADGNLCFTHYICSGWLSTSKHNDSCPTSMSLPVTNLLKIQWVLVITKSSNFHGEVSSMNQIYSFKKSSHLSTPAALSLKVWSPWQLSQEQTHIWSHFWQNSPYCRLECAIQHSKPAAQRLQENNSTGMRPLGI